MSDLSEVMGVFSSRKLRVSGYGEERKIKSFVKIYWFVRKLTDDQYEVQPLNVNHVPSGVVSIISKEDFMSQYEPEERFYSDKIEPILKKLNKAIEAGEEYYESGEMNAAEEAFCRALRLDDINVRATLGLGNVYCAKNDEEKIQEVLEKLLTLEGTFQKHMRHQFNKFGVNLRKQRIYDRALNFYKKALNIRENDENLHFNIARVYFCTTEITKCREHLATALNINPNFEEAQKFVRFLDKAGEKESVSLDYEGS